MFSLQLHKSSFIFHTSLNGKYFGYTIKLQVFTFIAFIDMSLIREIIFSQAQTFEIIKII
jgi:hypothetical protein